MKAFIIYADWDEQNEKTIVQLFGRLENNQSFCSINTHKPYFFVEKESFQKIKADLKVEIEESEFKTFNGEEVVKLSHSLQSELAKISKYLNSKKIQTYESDIKPHQQFLMDLEIKSSLKIEGESQSNERFDKLFIEPKIKPIDFKPELKVLSIDLESDKNGKLFCIGLYGKDCKKNFIISDKKNLKNSIICKTESECLEKAKQEIIKLDPDIITGWNIADFDFPYLRSLYEKHKISFDIGRTNQETRMRISSDFFKKSTITVPGRQVLDGLSMIRDPFIKEAPSVKYIDIDSWTLEDVSQAILGEGKLIKGKNRHEEITRLYKEKEHQKLVDYNLQDCKLAYDLLEKTRTLELAIERSELTGLTFDKLTASIAAFDSLYIREAHKRGLVSPTTEYTSKEERIKGGYVMDPKPGIYHDVLVLDFKSLYPSIIKTFNIDPASFLEKKEKNIITAPNGAMFKNQQGILPDVISKLHEARERAKKEKREFASYAIKIIMNSFFGVLANPNCRYFSLDIANAITHFAQHIIKLTAKKIEERGYKVIYSDSVSGKTKVIIKDKNKIYEEEIQNIFNKSKEEGLGKEYDFKEGLEVLTLDEKGKSVFKPIKYVMRHKSNKKMYRVHFTNNWHIEVTEDHSLMGYQSQAFNNSKENRESILKRITEIKPTEIKNKASSIVSLKKIPNKKTITKELPKKIYEFMGYFVGDGSFQRNKAYKTYKKDYYLRLSLGKDQEEVINNLILPLKENEYIKNYWLSKSRKGDVTINGLKLVKLISDNFSDETGRKKIPKWLFEETEENIASFLRGLFSADGCVMIRNDFPIIKYTSVDDDYIEIVRKLLYRVGISHSIFKENSLNKYKTDKKIYTSRTCSKNIIIQEKDAFTEKIGFILDRKNKLANIKTEGGKRKLVKNYEFDIQAVKNIEEIKTPDYVYDIEVEDNHRFFANYVLVHNTDSVFIDTEEKKADPRELEDYINNFYKNHVKEDYNRTSYLDIEFKRHYLSFLLPPVRAKSKDTEEESKGSKKRYAGLYKKDNKEELEIIGLEAIRGDWTDAAQDFQRELLMKIFHKEEFIKFIKDYVKKIREGKLNSKLIYRKSIRKNLDEYTKTTPPHVKAARKLDKLEGSTIEYYITEDGPEPIQKLKHKIDYEHYINKQIAPIANTILFFFKKDFKDIISSSEQTKLFS